MTSKRPFCAFRSHRFVPMLPVFLVLLSNGAPVARATQPAVGLIMAITGESADPKLTPMSEIRAGDTIKLATGATATILLYSRCEVVKVSGGNLLVGNAEIRGGQEVSVAAGPCPHIEQLSSDSSAGAAALVMRSSNEIQELPADVRVAVPSRRESAVTLAVITYKSGETVTVADAGAKIWDLGKAALMGAGTPGTIKLYGQAGNQVGEFQFKVGKPSGNSALLLLRMD